MNMPVPVIQFYEHIAGEDHKEAVHDWNNLAREQLSGQRHQDSLHRKDEQIAEAVIAVDVRRKMGDKSGQPPPDQLHKFIQKRQES